MTYGIMQVGRIPLREDSSYEMSVESGEVQISLAGQESYGRLTLDALRRRADELAALNGLIVPATFSQKDHLDGYYRVEEASGRYEEWQPQAVAIMPWTLRMTRVGYSTEMDLESRLSGPLTQATDHAVVGERWHAPPLGHGAYSAGSATPTVVTRTSMEGALTVYRGVPVGVHPRWSATPQAYSGGRVRLIDEEGFERQAVRTTLAPTGWTLHNGLVRVTVDGSGALDVAAWTGGAWQSTLWDIYYGTGPAVAMGTPTATSVLRNYYERVSLRLMKSLNPGRITVDLTLRRGSRFVELYVQHQYGTTLSIQRTVAEAGTVNTGYLRASAANGAGNRYVIGSALTFTAAAAQGGISVAATPTLDAFIGVEVGGAAAGDLGVDLLKQYLGAPEETVRGVRR